MPGTLPQRLKTSKKIPVCVQITKYSVSLERSKVLTHARARRSLENITPRGSSQHKGHGVSDSSNVNRQLQRRAAERGCQAGEEAPGGP